jgi:hypothetical protein
MDEARMLSDLRLQRIASQTGEIFPSIQAIRGSRSKKVFTFLKRSGFFSDKPSSGNSATSHYRYAFARCIGATESVSLCVRMKS